MGVMLRIHHIQIQIISKILARIAVEKCFGSLYTQFWCSHCNFRAKMRQKLMKIRKKHEIQRNFTDFFQLWVSDLTDEDVEDASQRVSNLI